MGKSQYTVMLKLTSHPRTIAEIETFVERLAQQYKLGPDLHGNILISLTEAVNNAIIHGNCNDESKTVHIQLRKQKNKLAILVSDEGCGFNVQNLPDPTAPENVFKIGGRGVFLMKELSDKIRFFNNGSTVEMQFNI